MGRASARRGFSIVPIALGIVLAAGCTASARGPSGPVVSPTGIVYEPGIPPVETRYSQTAALYLRQDRVDRALDLALQGLEADPDNPIHYYLAGTAYARLGEYASADSLFTEAQRMYPAYELDIEPEREAAWARAFNEGTDHYAEGDVAATIESWRGAALMFDLRPEVHRNLASVLAGEGRYDEAIEVYAAALEGLESRPATRVLGEEEVRQREEQVARTEEELAQLLLFRNRFAEAEPLLRRVLERDPDDVQARGDLAQALSGQGRDDEASVIYAGLLSEQSMEGSELFNLGVALFRTQDYERAAEAFQRLTRFQPNSRDAWFNYANALFADQRWDDLARVGERLVELDPLGENSQLITARAHLEVGDEAAARTGLERAESAPVHVEGLQMRPSGAETTIQGRVVGNQADPGTTVLLRFTFYGDGGTLGGETVRMAAPADDESRVFEISIPGRAAAYRYELLQ